MSLSMCEFRVCVACGIAPDLWTRMCPKPQAATSHLLTNKPILIKEKHFSLSGKCRKECNKIGRNRQKVKLCQGKMWKMCHLLGEKWKNAMVFSIALSPPDRVKKVCPGAATQSATHKWMQWAESRQKKSEFTFSNIFYSYRIQISKAN